MKRKETKKIFNINRRTLNIIGIALLTIIIIVISIVYSLQMKREYINGDKNLPFKLDKTTIRINKIIDTIIPINLVLLSFILIPHNKFYN